MPDVLRTDRDVGAVDREVALDTCTTACCEAPVSCLARRLILSSDSPQCDVWMCVDAHDEGGTTIGEIGAGVAVDFRCRRFYTTDDYAQTDAAVSGTFRLATEPYGPCWLLLNPCSGQGSVATVNGVQTTPPKVYLNVEALCGCKLLRVSFSHPSVDPLPDGVVDVACYVVERPENATPGIPNDPGAFLASGTTGPIQIANGSVSNPAAGSVSVVPSGQCCDCVPGCANTGGMREFFDACGRSVSLACCCSGNFRVTVQGSSWWRRYNEVGCSPVLAEEFTREVVVLPTILVVDGVVTVSDPGLIRDSHSGTDGATGQWVTEVTEYGLTLAGVGESVSDRYCPPSALLPIVGVVPPAPFDQATGYGCQGTLCGSTVSCDYVTFQNSFTCTGGYGALGEAGSCRYRDFEGASAFALVVERVGDCTGGCPGAPTGGSGGGGSSLFGALAGGV